MSGEIVKITMPALLAFLSYLCREELKNLSISIYSYFLDWVTCSLHIKKSGNEKIVYAILRYLEKRNEDCTRKFIVKQGNNEVNYMLCNGSYRVFFNHWIIFINVSDEDIVIWSFFFRNSNTKILQNFLQKIYIPDDTVDVLFFYLSRKGDAWDLPLFRRPRKNMTVTGDMQGILDDVHDFYDNEDLYEVRGWPFRRGYFIEGATGTGKSTIVESLAKEYHMCVYMVNLNSADMSDANLINLVSQVPPKSLVVFDEFDKQYSAVQNNPKAIVSDNGILVSIDGAQRLSHGTIVVAIVSDRTVFSQNFLTQLLRIGRLDKSVVFH